MPSPLRRLDTIDALDAAVAGSSLRPILIFKHSTTCGTSACAYEEVEALLAGPALPVDSYLVDVRAGRPVSNAIAERLAIRHESPQVLLIEDGKAVWHASHYRITQEAIADALLQHVPAARKDPSGQTV